MAGSRSSSRHKREIQGKDSGGYTPPDFGEKPTDPATNYPATGAPVIEGVAEYGEVLFANTSSIQDQNGLRPFTYHWRRGDTDIPDTNSAYYTVQAGDIGFTISVYVTFRDGDGFQEGPLFSDPTSIVPGSNLPPEGIPVITGSPVEAQTLTCDTSGITDPDGVNQATWTYQWQRGEQFGQDPEYYEWENIAGATAQTLLLTASEVDHKIRVYVYFDDDLGKTEGPLYSDPTSVVPAYNRPATGNPTISGQTMEGQTLTAGIGDIADANGFDPASVSYHWLRNGEDLPISARQSYTLVAGDVDQLISVRAQFIDFAGYSEARLSSQVGPIDQYNRKATGRPVITGTPTAGYTLTAGPGDIADYNGLGTFNYTWQKDGVDIPGQTGTTYVLLQADVGSTITVTVHFTDQRGYAEGPLVSFPTSEITANLGYYHSFASEDPATAGRYSLGGFTHTRASTAYGLASTQAYQSHDIDEPVYMGAGPLNDDDKLVGYGLQLEQLAINHVESPTDLSGPEWDKLGVTINDATEVTVTSAWGSVKQSLTLPSAEATVSFVLQRVKGLGGVNISAGGDVWHAVDVQTDARRLFTTGTNLDPTIGIQFETVGDVFRVHHVQFEDGDAPTSPIIGGTPPGQIGSVNACSGPTVAAAVAREKTDLRGTFTELMNLPAEGVSNNFCGQFIFILRSSFAALYTGGIGDVTIAELYNPEDADEALELVATSETNLRLRIRQGGVTTGMEVDFDVTGADVWNIFDVRWRKTDTSPGLVGWLDANRQEAASATADFGSPLYAVSVGSDHAGTTNTDINLVVAHIIPTSLDEGTVTGWATWEPPAPIIIQQPVSQTVDLGELVTAEIAVDHPVPEFFWEWSLDGGAWSSFATYGGFHFGETASRVYIHTGVLSAGDRLWVRCNASAYDDPSKYELSNNAIIDLSGAVHEYRHNFDTATLGGFTHERNRTTTMNDYLGDSIEVPVDVPAFVGGRYSGAWSDEGVGYGIQLEATDTLLYAAFDDLTAITGTRLLNDFCFQVTVRLALDFNSYADGAVFMMLHAESGGDAVSVYKHGNNTLAVGTIRGGGETTTTYTVSGLMAGDIADIRVRKSAAGLSVKLNDLAWTDNVADTTPLARPLLNVRYGIDVGGANRLAGEYQIAHLANAALPNATIEAWEGWSEPLPIITKQPEDIDFGGSAPVVPPVDPSPVSSSFALLFSDLIDGKYNGWHDDAAKGAAVTLWGMGFDLSTPANNVIEFTTGGTPTAIPSANIVEVVQDPHVYFLQRLTFHLSTDLSLGANEITVTVGTDKSEPLPFHVRATGRHIYFDANYLTGDNDGTWSKPYRYPGDYFTNGSDGTRSIAGDHYWFKNGTYIPSGDSSHRVLFGYGSRMATGLVDNSLTFSAVPGHSPFFDQMSTASDKFPAISSFNTGSSAPKAHYTISKFDLLGNAGGCNVGGSNDSRVVGCKFRGVHNSDGIGDYGWAGDASKGPINNNHKCLGNEFTGGSSQKSTDHAIYPGAGFNDWGVFEIGYNYIHGNDYGKGHLIAFNFNDYDAGDRIPYGKRILEIRVYNNLIDCRIAGDQPHGYTMDPGIRVSLGDGRPAHRLPTEGKKEGEPCYIYNNITIGSPNEPSNNDLFSISVRPTVAESYIFNNTCIDFAPVGAISIGSTPEDNGLTIVATVKGNVMTNTNSTNNKYVVDTTNGTNYQKVVEGNVYNNGDIATVFSGETNQIIADPLMTYDVDNMPTTAVTVAYNSPVIGATGFSFADRTRDFNHTLVRDDGGTTYSAGAVQPEGGLLWESDFDNMPDWTSGEGNAQNEKGSMYPWDGHTGIPDGYYAGRQSGDYTTRMDGGTEREVIEILASNADKARGGTGKSFVHWREARFTTQTDHKGEGTLAILLPEDQPKLYVEFDFCLSEEVVKTYYGTGTDQIAAGLGTTKMFRIRHWEGNNSQFYDFFTGNDWENSPKLIWNLMSNEWGMRNRWSMRARGTNDFKHTDPPGKGDGDCPWSWINDRVGQAVGGGTAVLIDKRDGVTEVPFGDLSYYAKPDEILGSSAFPEGGSPDRRWSKMAFYVEMNSAPGVADGRAVQWLDDKRVMNVKNVIWIKDEPGCTMVGWNVVDIGGNNYFSEKYPDAMVDGSPDPSNIQHQEWSAIDNVKIYSDIPKGRGLDEDRM